MMSRAIHSELKCWISRDSQKKITIISYKWYPLYAQFKPPLSNIFSYIRGADNALLDRFYLNAAPI